MASWPPVMPHTSLPFPTDCDCVHLISPLYPVMDIFCIFRCSFVRTLLIALNIIITTWRVVSAWSYVASAARDVLVMCTDSVTRSCSVLNSVLRSWGKTLGTTLLPMWVAPAVIPGHDSGARWPVWIHRTISGAKFPEKVYIPAESPTTCVHGVPALSFEGINPPLTGIELCN